MKEREKISPGGPNLQSFKLTNNICPKVKRSVHDCATLRVLDGKKIINIQTKFRLRIRPIISSFS